MLPYNYMITITSETYFPEGTPEDLKKVIEEARLSHERVRLVYASREPATLGRVLLEEYDVLGYIGRSTGREKIPLLLPRRSSSGGGAILLQLLGAVMRTRDSAFLWKRPEGLKLPELRVEFNAQTKMAEVFDCAPSDAPSNSSQGILVARFPTMDKAKRWVDFMLLKSMRL